MRMRVHVSVNVYCITYGCYGLTYDRQCIPAPVMGRDRNQACTTQQQRRVRTRRVYIDILRRPVLFGIFQQAAPPEEVLVSSSENDCYGVHCDIDGEATVQQPSVLQPFKQKHGVHTSSSITLGGAAHFWGEHFLFALSTVGLLPGASLSHHIPVGFWIECVRYLCTASWYSQYHQRGFPPLRWPSSLFIIGNEAYTTSMLNI